MKEEKYITLNGFNEKIYPGETVASLIERLEEKDKSLIVEKNGRFVYPLDYSKTVLNEGDSVEFINPNFGG